MTLMPGTSSDSPLVAGSALSPLEAQLDSFPLATSPRGCVVTIRNNTAPEREAVIVGAGVLFWFYDALPGTVRPSESDYMAGPVHIEVGAGMTVPFRFSDPRRPVYKVGVGVRVLFGNVGGFPPSQYENLFWEQVLPPLPLIQPPPLHERVGEIHLDFRVKRTAPLTPVGPAAPIPVIPMVPVWPPIPGPLRKPVGLANWFELAERPQ